MRLRDGSLSEGKKILIDGQQRVTALMAAVLGCQVLIKDYRLTRIHIAFNPLSRTFEVLNPAIEKDVTWIPDISDAMKNAANPFSMFKTYFAEVLEQCVGGSLKLGAINDRAELEKNLTQNCIPGALLDIDQVDYVEFLKARRELMAQKIKAYYNSL